MSSEYHEKYDGKYGHEPTADLMENMDVNPQMTYGKDGHGCTADLMENMDMDAQLI